MRARRLAFPAHPGCTNAHRNSATFGSRGPGRVPSKSMIATGIISRKMRFWWGQALDPFCPMLARLSAATSYPIVAAYLGAGVRYPICALILVDYHVSEDAPNGPIGTNQPSVRASSASISS